MGGELSGIGWKSEVEINASASSPCAMKARIKGFYRISVVYL